VSPSSSHVPAQQAQQRSPELPKSSRPSTRQASSNVSRASSQDARDGRPGAAAQPSASSSARAPSQEGPPSSNGSGSLRFSTRSPGNDLQLLRSRREAVGGDGLDEQVEAMRGALESTAALLRQGPELTLIKDEQPPDLTSFRALGGEQSAVMTWVREEMERYQLQQRERLSTLASQWERRTAALEQALNNGLETAVNATATMNGRMTQFMRLAEVLETAVERSITTSKDQARLASKVLTVEDDVACLARDLAADKAERTRNQAMLTKQAEAQVAALCDTVRDELRHLQYFGASLRQASGASGDDPQQLPPGEANHLAWELSEERAERRRLAQELQATRSDTELIRSSLDATNEHLLRLARDLERSSGGTASSGSKQDLLSGVRQSSSSRHKSRHQGHNRPASAFGRIDEEPPLLQSDTGSDANEPEPATFGGVSRVGTPVQRGWGATPGSVAAATSVGAPQSSTPSSSQEADSPQGSTGSVTGGAFFDSMSRFMGRG